MTRSVTWVSPTHPSLLRSRTSAQETYRTVPSPSSPGRTSSTATIPRRKGSTTSPSCAPWRPCSACRNPALSSPTPRGRPASPTTPSSPTCSCPCPSDPAELRPLSAGAEPPPPPFPSPGEGGGRGRERGRGEGSVPEHRRHRLAVRHLLLGHREDLAAVQEGLDRRVVEEILSSLLRPILILLQPDLALLRVVAPPEADAAGHEQGVDPPVVGRRQDLLVAAGGAAGAQQVAIALCGAATVGGQHGLDDLPGHVAQLLRREPLGVAGEPLVQDLGMLGGLLVAREQVLHPGQHHGDVAVHGSEEGLVRQVEVLHDLGLEIALGSAGP